MAGEVAQHPSPTSLQPPNRGNSASSQRRSSGHRLQASIHSPGLGPGPCPMPMPMPMPTPSLSPRRCPCFGSERHANHLRKQQARSNEPSYRRPGPTAPWHKGATAPPTKQAACRFDSSGQEEASDDSRTVLHKSGRTPGQCGRLCVNVSSRRTEASDRQLHSIVPCPAHTINGLA